MFFNAVYRLSIWEDLDNKSRNIRLLVLGAILYIIVHSFIYSNYVQSIDIIQKYRNYLYYLIGIDLSLVGVLMFTENTKNSNKKKKLKKRKLMYQMQQQPMQPLPQQPIQQQPMQPMQPLPQRPMQQMQPTQQPIQPLPQQQNIKMNQNLQQMQLQQLQQMKQQYQKQNQQQIPNDTNSVEIPIYNSNSHNMNWNDISKQPDNIPIQNIYASQETDPVNQYIEEEESIPIYNPIKQQMQLNTFA